MSRMLYELGNRVLAIDYGKSALRIYEQATSSDVENVKKQLEEWYSSL
jgi:hypothetical protein